MFRNLNMLELDYASLAGHRSPDLNCAGALRRIEHDLEVQYSAPWPDPRVALLGR